MRRRRSVGKRSRKTAGAVDKSKPEQLMSNGDVVEKVIEQFLSLVDMPTMRVVFSKKLNPVWGLALRVAVAESFGRISWGITCNQQAQGDDKSFDPAAARSSTSNELRPWRAIELRKCQSLSVPTLVSLMDRQASL